MNSTESLTTQPPCTVVAQVGETGHCFVPDVFAPELEKLMAALDWARVFNTSQSHASTVGELDAAAEAARNVAAMCERFSVAAKRCVGL